MLRLQECHHERFVMCWEPPRPLHTLGEHSTTEVYLHLSVTQEHVPQNSKTRWRTNFVRMPITQKTQLDDVILRVTETDGHRSLSEQSAKAAENAQLGFTKRVPVTTMGNSWKAPWYQG